VPIASLACTDSFFEFGEESGVSSVVALLNVIMSSPVVDFLLLEDRRFVAAFTFLARKTDLDAKRVELNTTIATMPWS
jgi:hypothetical protein